MSSHGTRLQSPLLRIWLKTMGGHSKTEGGTKWLDRVIGSRGRGFYRAGSKGTLEHPRRATWLWYGSESSKRVADHLSATDGEPNHPLSLCSRFEDVRPAYCDSELAT